jgi:hypothetical protein
VTISDAILCNGCANDGNVSPDVIGGTTLCASAGGDDSDAQYGINLASQIRILRLMELVDPLQKFVG